VLNWAAEFQLWINDIRTPAAYYVCTFVNIVISNDNALDNCDDYLVMDG